MNISSDTLAIVAATFLGPIFAIWITLWRGKVNARDDRRLHVFRTLMSTRRVAISKEHVNALNLVEVEFYGCDGVEAAWRAYLAHLNSPITDDAAWGENRDKLLAKLLSEIATVLGFNLPAMDLFKGGYAPRGWEISDTLYTGALEYMRGLSEGKKFVPISVERVVQPPTPPSIKPNPPGST